MNPSGIITLITDFGLSDPYVAMMKGVILTISPGTRPVDISHRIKAGSISQAAGLLQETFPYFPQGTVHVAVVDPGVGSERRPIAIESKAHFFVGPDNGIFWPLIEDDHGAEIVQLAENKYFRPSESHTFHGRDIFAPVAAHLSRGADLREMGPAIDDPVSLAIQKPYPKKGILYGQICRVDHFGNLITNIHQEDLERFLGSAQPIIAVGNLVIRKISRIYADCDEGKPLALINSSNMLEIAVNLGQAAEYLGKVTGEIPGTIVKVKKA